MKKQHKHNILILEDKRSESDLNLKIIFFNTMLSKKNKI